MEKGIPDPGNIGDVGLREDEAQRRIGMYGFQRRRQRVCRGTKRQQGKATGRIAVVAQLSRTAAHFFSYQNDDNDAAAGSSAPPDKQSFL